MVSLSNSIRCTRSMKVRVLTLLLCNMSLPLMASGFAVLPSSTAWRWPLHRVALAGGDSPPSFVIITKKMSRNAKRGTLFANDDSSEQKESLSMAGTATTFFRNRTALGLAAWFTTLSYFMVQNYKFGPWPTTFPLLLPKRGWVLVHALSSMLFSGGIILSTILEWSLAAVRNPEVVRFWFSETVSHVDKAIVLPSLTMAIISGMAQAAIDYQSMRAAPLHIRVAMHILATFAVWWGCTDLTTQQASKAAVSEWYQQNKDKRHAHQHEVLDPLPKVLVLRRWSNVLSCLFVASLYAFMALKPGYTSVLELFEKSTGL